MSPELNGISGQPIDVLMAQPDMSPSMQDGAMLSPQPDGGMLVDLAPQESMGEAGEQGFDANLAEALAVSKPDELMSIAGDLLRGIQADIDSRQEWEGMFAKGVELLGLKIDDASGEVTASGSVSKVYHPLLLEAVVRYQSSAMGEMLPASGPVKVRDDMVNSPLARSELAEALEKDFNHYLTCVAKEYYPDFDRMLFIQGFSGCIFRKVYRCPLRKRPVSEYITGLDFIVSNNAVSLYDCDRKTHRIKMRQSTVKRLQHVGHYRDVALVAPTENPTESEQRVKGIEGISATPTQTEDQRHTIYECYTELEIEGITQDGAPEGIPLPYRVTIDKDSMTILEIRRNWVDGDADFKERRRFVKYGLIPGLGFYDYGFVHLLGNTDRALTAILRQLLDAGQFANFPVFLLSKAAGRQETTQIRIPPGGGQEIDTGGQSIQDAVMALPYKEPSVVLAEFSQKVAEDARRLGMTTDIQVGDGRQDAPVGTTLALLEQSTKIMAAVHKRNHVTQQEEFEILKELFAEDPTALWRFAASPNRRWQMAEEFKDMLLVPASDPNVPSHMHRIMNCMAILQLSAQKPELYDDSKVHTFVLKQLGIADPQDLFKPPQQPDPRAAELGMAFVKAETDKSVAEAQRAQADAEYKKVEPLFDAQKIKQKDREIDIKAAQAMHTGIAALQPKGYASGGAVRSDTTYALAQAITTLAQNQQAMSEQMRNAVDRMGAPRRKTIKNAPRDPVTGRIDWQNVEYIDEPYSPEEDIIVITDENQ